MLYQMPTYVQHTCLHVIALADAATQEGKMLSLCCFQGLGVQQAHDMNSEICLWQSAVCYPVPCYSFHEQTALTSA